MKNRECFATLQQFNSVPFRGDEDEHRLLAFLSAENQFNGNTRWDYGSSLKSAYCNLFETFNYTPVHRLWIDKEDTIHACSYICPNTSSWRFQRRVIDGIDFNTNWIVAEAEAVLNLLSDSPSITTYAYESRTDTANILVNCGYEAKDKSEVFMEMSLTGSVPDKDSDSAIKLRLLNNQNKNEILQRCYVQLSAFVGDQYELKQEEWMKRTLAHQFAYNKQCHGLDVVAFDNQGVMCSFAAIIFDGINGIAEFEPVGTLTKYQRQGFAKAVLLEGLSIMKKHGIKKAVVRTGCDNEAAIAAYQSVGFVITDYLVEYNKKTSGKTF